MSVFFSSITSSIHSFLSRVTANIDVIKTSENPYVSAIAKIVLSEFGARIMALGLAGGCVYFALENKYQAGVLFQTFPVRADDRLVVVAKSDERNTRANRQVAAALAIVVFLEAVITIRHSNQEKSRIYDYGLPCWVLSTLYKRKLNFDREKILYELIFSGIYSGSDDTVADLE